MLLAIDQGNSDVVFGMHDGSTWRYEWRTPTTDKSVAAYEAIMRQWLLEASLNVSSIESVVISSVVPENKEVLLTFVEELFRIQPLVLGREIYGKLGLQLNSPHEVGSDLVSNAIAATNLHPGQHCIIVDFGTALTITTAHNKTILGVAIAPGLQTAVKSLFKHTAQLPEVPLELPDSVLGKNTIHAIQAGVLHGYIGLARHLIEQSRNEIQQECTILATGGLSSVLKPLTDDFDLIEPKLTLDGLRIIYQKINGQ